MSASERSGADEVRVPGAGIATTSAVGPVSTHIRDLVAIENEPSFRNVTLTEEHDDVRASRLRHEEADAVEHRLIGRINLCGYLAALLGAAVFCAYLTVLAPAAEIRDKAFTALVALITGSFGYLAGEKVARGRTDKS